MLTIPRMKILVTGATGFVGQSVMRQLAARGADAQPFHGRINDAVRLREQLDGVHTVIHLAGAETAGRRRLLEQVDVFGTEQLLRAAFHRNVQHLIVISRFNANPNAMYPVQWAKGRVERLVRRSQLPYTIVRCATLFGRNDRFTNTLSALADWTWPFVWLPGNGRTTFQPLWVEDAARCLVDLVGRRDKLGQTLQIAGGERFAYRDFMRYLLAASGLRRRALYVRPQLVRAAHTLLFAWWRRPPVSPFLLDLFSLSEVTALDAVRRDFGFQPARLEHHLAHLRGGFLRWRLLVP